MKNTLSLIVLMFLIISCNNSKNQVSYAKTNSATKKDTVHQGKILMETYCYACHNPAGTESNRLAPPMIAIKKHYISDNTTKTKFINDIQNWIANPNEKTQKCMAQ